MSSLDRMKNRISYTGYDLHDKKNVREKYYSFCSALKNSYQAEWITLNKGKENETRWRCLINPSRLTAQFDKKVLSINFDSKVTEGTIFWWDRTNRYWIVDLQQHTEEAYFRGTITRADYEVDVDGDPYIISLRGPVETTTVWNQKHGIAWNDLNYSMVMKITKDSKTVNYFSRHRVIKVKLNYHDAETDEMLEEWHNWKVVATDKYSQERIMEVYLDEWYDNEMEDAMIPEEEEIPDLMLPHIEGPSACHVFDDNVVFSVVGITSGKFVVNSNKVKIKSSTDKSCILEIIAGKAFSFTLSFVGDDGTQIDKVIEVKSF